NLEYSVSVTTRPPRAGEVDGKDYYFVNRPQFEEMIKQDRFLEYAEFVGSYYGTPKDKIDELLDKGKEVVLEIEVDGALQVREKMKEAVFIFLVPPSKKALLERLSQRGTDSAEIVNKRFQKAESEFKLAYKYDYIVVNDDVKNAADRIMAIIRAEHARTQRTIQKYSQLMEE